MRCPICENVRDKVIETRSDADETLIRRRRECASCKWRFTTYERADASERVVVKSDGRRRERLDRQKLRRGIEAATENLDIAPETIDRIVDDVLDGLGSRGSRILSADIGALVEQHLQQLNPVAFIRYASVHRRFKTPEEFVSLVRQVPPPLMVVKRDSRRQPFDVARIRRGIQWAVKHTTLDDSEKVSAITDAVIQEIYGFGAEIPTSVIGKAVQRQLRRRDAVSYLRFTSVFERFDTADRFLEVATATLETRSGA